MSDPAGCCILVPTTSRYVSIARFTARQIKTYWDDAPPLYFCGVDGGANQEWLPLSDDPRDWIGIALTAARYLRKHYRYCYLILDDHPPLWRCNSHLLNEGLPNLMDELNGAYLGLNGWGPGREGRRPGGEILGRRYLYIEKVDSDFRWKFSLHPALWSMDALTAVLHACAQGKDPRTRTAWYFERRAGAPDVEPAEVDGAGAYRVCGRVTTASRVRYVFERILRLGVRAGTHVCRRLGLSPMANRLSVIGNAIDQYYEGPYPLFWSGVMQRGRLNSDLLTYLQLHHRLRYRDRLLRAVEGQMEPGNVSESPASE